MNTHSTEDPIEWEFDVPASQVDLKRIVGELNGVKAIYTYAYMEQLKKNAPTTFARLGQWAAENNRLHGIKFD